MDDADVLVEFIEDLGKRHIKYGVTVKQWKSLGDTLMWTLEETFEDGFTGEVRSAWQAVYDYIAQTAIAAAYPR